MIYKHIVEGNAILITGSGAHIDVYTPDGEKFPSGVILAKQLYKLCGIDNPENPWDLQDASETYQEKFTADKLVQEIQKQLMVGQVQEEHRLLYSYNWQRVYTTNYDDVPRVSTRKNENPLIPVTLSASRKEGDLQNNLCIYINGYIGKLTPETLNDEFKLTGRSYLAADNLNESEWGAVFSEDMETADCIVIVGLSLDYDLDIKRFIFSKKVIDKIVFIEAENITEDKKRKLERMGTVEMIGLNLFVKELSLFQGKYSIQDVGNIQNLYKSFEIYEPKKTIRSASSLEVYDFFMSGQTQDNLWYRKQGKYNSIVFRKKIFEVIRCIMDGCKIIYLHANLGNGKTMFIESVKHQIQNKGIKIFTLKEYHQGITVKEIRNIVEEKGKKIVIIENYYNYLSALKQFALHNSSDIQFILSARSVLYDTRITEVNDMFNIQIGQSAIFDLNKLENAEIAEMCRILDANGLWGQNNKLSDKEKRKLLVERQKGNGELQGIMLGILKSTFMKNKIEVVVKNIKKMSNEYFEILILALLIKVMSLNIRANDMSKILNVKIALDTQFTNDSNVQEILEFSTGETEFRLKSAVTANAILQDLDCNETIIKVLLQTARYANRYSSIEKYENVLKNIISYSHVKTFLLKSGQKEAFLINYYDSLKELDYYKENSFYWLQYSIACTNIERYDLAQIYLDNAYSLFRDSEKTVPFQIDTQQAKLNLLQIEKRKITDVKGKFMQAHELLMKPIVSNKDNPEKQIINFYFYTHKSVKEQMIKADGRKEYCFYCGEAYNKVNDYLKYQHIKNGKNNFVELSTKLLNCSIECS